jgi:glycosyltransferase involved in cell wall biosynthesis
MGDRIMASTTVKAVKSKNSHEKRILLISCLILDFHLSKTTQLEILRALANRGHVVTLIAMRSKSQFQNENSKVHIISIPLRQVPIVSNIMYAAALLFFLPFYVLFSKPDYIITDSEVPILGLASIFLLSKLKGIKLVLDIRSTPVEIRPNIRGFAKTFSFFISGHVARRLFDGITILTPSMMKEVCKKFGIDSKRVGVWSSGVNLTLFNPRTHNSERENLRRKLGLTKRFVVLYHGVFTANRGLIETVEAMSMIKTTCPDVVFFLLGAGFCGQSLKDMIKDKELQDNVIVHNPVDYQQVPDYIAMCDIGIIPLPDHPYWRFQCPLKLLEYLAMNKPVIATRIPSHETVIGKETCGFFISSVNPTEIAKVILFAYLNRKKLESMNLSGREIVTKEYSWEKVARDLEDYLLST